MTENYAAKPKTKPFAGAGATEGPEAMRAAAEIGTAYAKDMFAKSQAAVQDTKKVLEQTYTTATKGAAEFNLQLLEVMRANTNAAFDFAHALLAAKSPTSSRADRRAYAPAGRDLHRAEPAARDARAESDDRGRSTAADPRDQRIRQGALIALARAAASISPPPTLRPFV